MKTVTAVVAAMIIASAAKAYEPTYFADPAAYACKGVTKTAESYLAALASTNEGVVESALAHVAMIKLAMPACELKSLRTRVAEIERNAGSAEVRYKAFLTRTVLEEPAIFATVVTTGYAEPDELFGVLASRMGEYYAAK